MPELPEVETIKRQLATVLPGKVFKSVEVRLAKQVKGMTAQSFKKQVVGSKIIDLDRRAKMLIIKTNCRANGRAIEQSLVFHLKMSGQLIYQDKHKLRGGGHPIKGALEQLPNKYSHVFFTFKDGAKLFFNDTRQFGWVTIVKSYVDIESLSKSPLGPEPLSDKFSIKQFTACMKARPKLNIYQALLDQKCVVGVGNIYANESLFAASIKPTRRARVVTNIKYTHLFNTIRNLLAVAVQQRGTTIDKYMDALGGFGNFSTHLKVYQRDEKRCVRRSCSGIIKRLKINGRSVFYCPMCQK